MSETEQIASLNAKISLLKNLVWLVSALLVATIVVAGWTWTQLTGKFVRYGEPMRVMAITDDGVGLYAQIDYRGRPDSTSVAAVRKNPDSIPAHWILERGEIN